MELRDQAKLTMTGVVVKGGPANCDLGRRGIVALGANDVTLDRVRMTNLPGGAIHGSSSSFTRVLGSDIHAAYTDALCKPPAAVALDEHGQLDLANSEVGSNRSGQMVGIQQDSPSEL